MANDIGHVATVELEASLKRFTSFCNAKGAETKDKKECEIGKIVPMSQGKYKGTSDCIYNSHHMQYAMMMMFCIFLNSLLECKNK